ncbi:MAG: hypothetical protein K2I99_08220 [Bacteroidaceae bacterium]|nr:hypothetical protein [Bacteroidaceae bacterium]MDE6722456.1 hypothetical protein [Bacteroidaceae bacterium]
MTQIINTYVLGRQKMFVLLLITLFTNSWTFAQNIPETTKPLTDMEVVRKVARLDIEREYYEDVIISFKSITPDYFISDKYKVKVKVVDKNGKSIYKKTLKNVFLYVFSDGQIQVGRKNFDQIVVSKSKTTDDYTGIIREKEGVY